MLIKAIKPLRSLRSLLAFALMFWCAGTGCMIVSYARAASNDLSAVAGAVDQAIAGSMSMDAHACCKAKRPSAKTHGVSEHKATSSPLFNLFTTPTTPTRTGVMNCCPLTTGSIVATSRPQSPDSTTVLLETNSSSFLSLHSDLMPLAVPLRLPNRAHSYLLDCAFLI